MRRAALLPLALVSFVMVRSEVAFADPTVAECLSATESSLELRKAGRLRATRAELLVCSAATCPVDIRQECTHRIEATNAAIPTVVFSAKTTEGAELSAVKITMEGEVVADRLNGDAIALDPGAHDFTFEASGLAPLHESLILHVGEKNRAESVVMTASAPTAPRATHASDAAPAPQSTEGRTQRLIGLAAGATGVAGLIVASVFGGLTISAWHDASAECPSHRGCGPSALHDGSDAMTYGAISTGTFIAGGVLAAGGATLYFTAPRPRAPAVGMIAAPWSVALVGSF